MAQVELRFFTLFGDSKRLAIAQLSKATVAKVHYDIDEVSPGDITLVVPELDTDLSESDANYELEISESSDHWPRDPETGELLVHDLAEAVLKERAERISMALREVFVNNSHNIFEVNGMATGWVPYKPELPQL